MSSPASSSIFRSFGLWASLAMFVAVVGLVTPPAVHVWRIQQFRADLAEVRGRMTTEPVVPVWLRQVLGEAASVNFDRVVEVRAYTKKVDDVWVRRLQQFPHLHSLYLNDTSVGDAGLESLQDLGKLRVLQLPGTAITDRGLQTIASQWPDLVELRVGRTRVTDAGLRHLSGMKHLQALGLLNDNVTDDGLLVLSGLPELNDLYLSGTKITDRGLWQLSHLRLKEIRLGDTAITDAGLEFLRAMPLVYIDIGIEKTSIYGRWRLRQQHRKAEISTDDFSEWELMDEEEPTEFFEVIIR